MPIKNTCSALIGKRVISSSTTYMMIREIKGRKMNTTPLNNSRATMDAALSLATPPHYLAAGSLMS